MAYNMFLARELLSIKTMKDGLVIWFYSTTNVTILLAGIFIISSCVFMPL